MQWQQQDRQEREQSDLAGCCPKDKSQSPAPEKVSRDAKISWYYLCILTSAEFYGSVKELPAAILAHLKQKSKPENEVYPTVAIFPLSALKAKL